MRRAVVVTLLLAGALTAPTSSHAARSCPHLLVDPRGDVDTMFSPSALVPTDEVDLVFADLRTTKKEVVASVGLVNLEDENASMTDRSYEVAFTTNGERYSLTFLGGRPNNTAYAWHVIAGDDNPEQSQGAGAQAAEGVGEASAFTVDRRANRVTIRFPRAIFSEYGGIGRSLTTVSASAWWGNGVRPTEESGFVGSYGSSDFGYTTTAYRDGSASCVS